MVNSCVMENGKGEVTNEEIGIADHEETVSFVSVLEEALDGVLSPATAVEPFLSHVLFFRTDTEAEKRVFLKYIFPKYRNKALEKEYTGGTVLY